MFINVYCCKGGHRCILVCSNMHTTYYNIHQKVVMGHMSYEGTKKDVGFITKVSAYLHNLGQSQKMLIIALIALSKQRSNGLSSVCLSVWVYPRHIIHHYNGIWATCAPGRRNMHHSGAICTTVHKGPRLCRVQQRAIRVITSLRCLSVRL